LFDAVGLAGVALRAASSMCLSIGFKAIIVYNIEIEVEYFGAKDATSARIPICWAANRYFVSQGKVSL
jgi:hypothetical protein